MAFEKPEPAKPEKPEGLNEIAGDLADIELVIAETLPEMERDDAQLCLYGMRQIEMQLERYADFSVWLAEHGRT